MMINITWIHFVFLVAAFACFTNVESSPRKEQKGTKNITKTDFNNMTTPSHNISGNSTKAQIFKDILTLVKTAGRSGGFGLLLARDILADVTDFITDLFVKKDHYISEEYYYGNYEDIDSSFITSVEDEA